jgi:type IV pilus assembly protein PilN
MMVVQINLLPKKEQKNRTYLLIMVIFIMILVVTSFLFYRKIASLKEEIQQIQNEASEMEAMRISLEKKTEANHQANVENIKVLQEMVERAEQLPINTVDLLARISNLLPKSAYIETFQYVEQTISMTIVIREEMEAAYFYRLLLEEKWTEDVKVLNVQAIREDAENINTLSEYRAKLEIVLDKEALKTLQKEDPS